VLGALGVDAAGQGLPLVPAGPGLAAIPSEASSPISKLQCVILEHYIDLKIISSIDVLLFLCFSALGSPQFRPFGQCVTNGVPALLSGRPPARSPARPPARSPARSPVRWPGAVIGGPQVGWVVGQAIFPGLASGLDFRSSAVVGSWCAARGTTHPFGRIDLGLPRLESGMSR
jgi:hypothetical protein